MLMGTFKGDQNLLLANKRSPWQTGYAGKDRTVREVLVCRSLLSALTCRAHHRSITAAVEVHQQKRCVTQLGNLPY